MWGHVYQGGGKLNFSSWVVSPSGSKRPAKNYFVGMLKTNRATD